MTPCVKYIFKKSPSVGILHSNIVIFLKIKFPKSSFQHVTVSKNMSVWLYITCEYIFKVSKCVNVLFKHYFQTLDNHQCTITLHTYIPHILYIRLTHCLYFVWIWVHVIKWKTSMLQTPVSHLSILLRENVCCHRTPTHKYKCTHWHVLHATMCIFSTCTQPDWSHNLTDPPQFLQVKVAWLWNKKSNKKKKQQLT